MKHRSLSVLVLIVGMGMVAASALAQTSTSTASSTIENVTVATVNVQNAKITSQTGNELSLAFNITNRTGTQPEIRYGVMVLQAGTNGQLTVADEKIYNEVISLNGDDSAFEEVTYTPPSYLTGKYTIMVVAENPEGLLLGETPAGTATFTGASHYLEVIPSSCYLTVTDDATSTEYTLTQGVDVLPAEHLILNCSVENDLGASVTTTPTFDSYYRSVFGMLVATSTLSPISIPAQGAPVTEMFEIPKVTAPQAYDAVFTLQGPGVASSSNSVIVHYVVQGESATVQNVVFDKPSYNSGDTAQVSITWTGTAGDFEGSRISPTDTGPINATVNVESGGNVSCAAPSTQTIPSGQVAATFAIPMTANCPGPKAEVTLADGSGTVLAETYFATGTPMLATSVASGTAPAASNNTMLYLILIGILILLIIIGIVYFFMKKRNTPPDMGNVVKVIIFIVAMSAGMFGVHAAKADTVISTINLPEYETSGGVKIAQYVYQVTYTFNLDQSTYAPGGQLTALTTVTGASCSNGATNRTEGQNIDATVNSVKQSLLTGGIGQLTAGQGTFVVQTTPGTYAAVFNAQGVANYDGIILDSSPINDSIPYTVAVGGGSAPSGPSTSSTGSGSSTSGGGTPSGPTTPAQPPVCSFTSNPSHIVIPESSNLYYSCQHVTACSISGGQLGNYPGISVPVDSSLNTASGTQAVQPNADTNYELDCTEANSGVNYSDELETYVIVDSPDLIEINPNL
jgi:hypothetical protein